MTVTEEHVSVDLSLNMKYGYSIPAVSEKVQDKVKTAIENYDGTDGFGGKISRSQALIWMRISRR